MKDQQISHRSNQKLTAPIHHGHTISFAHVQDNFGQEVQKQVEIDRNERVLTEQPRQNEFKTVNFATGIGGYQSFGPPLLSNAQQLSSRPQLPPASLDHDASHDASEYLGPQTPISMTITDEGAVSQRTTEDQQRMFIFKQTEDRNLERKQIQEVPSARSEIHKSQKSEKNSKEQPNQDRPIIQEFQNQDEEIYDLRKELLIIKRDKVLSPAFFEQSKYDEVMERLHKEIQEAADHIGKYQTEQEFIQIMEQSKDNSSIVRINEESARIEREIAQAKMNYEQNIKDRERQTKILHSIKIKQLELQDEVFDQRNYMQSQKMESEKMKREIMALKRVKQQQWAEKSVLENQDSHINNQLQGQSTIIERKIKDLDEMNSKNNAKRICTETQEEKIMTSNLNKRQAQVSIDRQNDENIKINNIIEQLKKQQDLNKIQIDQMKTFLQQLHTHNNQQNEQLDNFTNIQMSHDQAVIDLKGEKIRSSSIRNEQMDLQRKKQHLLMSMHTLSKHNDEITVDLEQRMIDHKREVRSQVNDLKISNKAQEAEKPTAVGRSLTRINATKLQIKEGNKKHWKMRHMLAKANEVENQNPNLA